MERTQLIDELYTKGRLSRHIRRLRKMSMSKRIIVGFAIVLLLMIINVVSAGLSLKKGGDNLTAFIDGAYTANGAIKECRIQANAIAAYVREMALLEETSTYSTYLAKIEDAKKMLKDNISLLKKSAGKDASQLDAYEASAESWLTIADNIVKEIQNGNTNTAEQMILTECAPALENFMDSAKNIDETIARQADGALIRNRNTLIISVTILNVFLVLAIWFSLVLSARIAASISIPLRKIVTASSEMAKGNLDTGLTPEGNDEITVVSASLASSMKSMSSYVSDIDRIMKEMENGNFDIRKAQDYVGDFKSIETSIFNFCSKMSETMKQIDMSSKQVADSADQIAHGAESLTEGAANQTTYIQQLQDVIDSVSTEVEKNALNSEKANEMAHTVGKDISNSNTQMKSMVEAMKDISDSSDQISKIIDSINDIAEQTNLLALNASIEAARAGEAGKGFAVVADQVSKLAGESAEAAKNSTELIHSSIQAVERGMSLVDSTAEALGNSAEKTEALVESIDQISDASIRQAGELSKITRGVEQIAEVVEENTAMAEESAASSQQMAGLAELLKNMLLRFQLKK